MTSFRVANEQAGMQYRDVWTTAYINDLPDSAFLYIAPGGTKTAGKTDGAHRYFPVRDATGKVDAAHVNNAIARIPQASDLSADVRAAAMAKAKALAAGHPDIGSGKTAEYEGSAGSGRSRERIPAELMGIQTRTFCDLELRVGGDGRTVHGRAVPFGQTIEIPGGRERFVPGAFTAQIANGGHGRVRLFASHGGRLSGDVTEAVGRTVELSERQDGLHGAWAMYETPKGDAALYLVKTGQVTGLSVGFKANDGGTRKGADGALERYAATLDHVALTNDPAYAGAQVTAVRSKMSAGSYRRDLERARGILTRVLADS
jgi:uncharacterized protein